jgi:hypothetical protein
LDFLFLIKNGKEIKIYRKNKNNNMNYVDSFYNFAPNDGSINFNELFSLNESGTSARYNKEEFKSLFRDSLLESEGYVDEDLLEGAHAYYELGVLYEHKSEWVESDSSSKDVFLDCDSHIILMKNGIGYVIEKNTLDIAKSINEGALSWLEDKWNKAKEIGKAAIKKTVSVVKGGWDALSYGAKKAWEFVKSCASAVVQFVKDMTWVEWAALGCSVLSAILGLLAAAAYGSGAFAWAAPPIAVIGGILQGLGGGIHIYEGIHKSMNAYKLYAKATEITPTAKFVSIVAQGLPEVLIGGGMLALGIYDIVVAGTTIVNPTAAIQGLATGATVKTGLGKAAKTVSKPGGAVHHFIEHAGVSVAKKLGVNLAKNVADTAAKAALKKAGAAAIGKILTGTVALVSSSIFSTVIGWVWKGFLKNVSMITKGFDFLINIPKKITEGIDGFVKKSDKGGTFAKIIAKGLDKLVKPMSSSAAKVIGKYMQPIVDKCKSWADREVKAFNKSEEILKEYKHELHTGIKHVEVHKPKKVENPNAPKHEIDPNKVTKKDIKIVKKAVNKTKGKDDKKDKKVKESSLWERKYVSSFDNLDFI